MEQKMRSGCFGQRLKNGKAILAGFIIAAVLLAIGQSLMAEDQIKVSRSFVRKLKYITADEAKKQLAILNVATDINKLPKLNALIITTNNPTDRIKATSVLNLIDSKLKYEIRKLSTAPTPGTVPTAADLDTCIKGMTIGSFIDPPQSDDGPLAIVGMHDTDLITIAPKGLIKHIAAGLGKLSKVQKTEIPQFKSSQETTVEKITEPEITIPQVTLPETAQQKPSKILDKVERIESAEKQPEVTNTEKTSDISKQEPTPAKLAEHSNIEKELAEARKELAAVMKEYKEAEQELLQAQENTKAAPAPRVETIIEIKPIAPAVKAKPKAPEKRPVTPAKQAKPAATAASAKPALKPDKVIAKKAEPPKAASADDGMAELMKAVAMLKAKDNPKEPPAEQPAKTTPAKKAPAPEKTAAKPTDTIPEEELETTITLPTKVQIPELLKLVGMQLGLNYMYDPAEIQGEVTLFLYDGGKIKVGELYALVQSALKFKGFVMTRKGKLVTVVPQAKTAEIDPQFVGEGEEIEVGDGVVTKIFKLEHIDTAIAEKMLAELKLSITIQSIAQNNTMIITGYASRMQRIQEVLDMVDKAGKKRIFKYRTLLYTAPSSLVAKIETLARELGTVSITISSSSSAVKAAPPSTAPLPRDPKQRAVELARRRVAATRAATLKTASATTIGSAPTTGVFLDIDDRTNRILMIGHVDDIAIIDDLIDSFDVRQHELKVIRQYEIENVDATMVIDILNELGVTEGGPRPLTAPTTTRGASSGEGPQISLLETTNSLLINATPEQHERIVLVIAHIDVTNPDKRVIKEYEIQSVDTAEVLETMVDLGIISSMTGGSTSRTSGRSTAARVSPSVPGKTTTARTTASPVSGRSSEPLVDEPQVAVLETTNSLLINATSKQHASIAMVIAHVDRELSETSTPYVIYPLENQDPVELKPILDELVDATIAAQTDTKSAGTSAAAAKTVTAPKTSSRSEDDRITIVADPKTYSLVVYASKKNQTWIGNLITDLDAYRPQVLLDVTLVEISKNDIFEYDLELVSSLPNLANTSGVLSSIAGTTTDAIASALEGAHDRSQFADFAFNSASGGRGFYADTHVNALLKLMQQKGYGRVLASPKLLVNDNEQGTITTSDSTYVTRTDSSNSTGDNPVITESTRDDKYTAGITLSIEPHISTGDNLRLIIQLDRSDFGNITGNRPPDTADNNVSTTVTVPNNSTIILGGMERLNQSKGGTKIPILGDIPLIGGLFRTTSNSDIQKKLYIFVKAHILRPGDGDKGASDIRRISEKNRNEFEKMEIQMQEYQDWPGIKPKPMEPIHILDEDEDEELVEYDGSKAIIEVRP